LGQWQEAAADYRKAIALDESSGRAYHCAAWLMATCPDDRYRDAQLAIQAAEKAAELDGRDDFAYLDTLAAAYANAGQFDKARKAIAEAIPIAPKDHVKPLQRRLELYQQNQPYREGAQIAGRSESGAVR
jgi:tetratricopeptide (TPR) repeat protein